jgi:hypothetical protein
MPREEWLSLLACLAGLLHKSDRISSPLNEEGDAVRRPPKFYLHLQERQCLDCYEQLVHRIDIFTDGIS